MYIDVIKELIVKTAGQTVDEVTLYDLLIVAIGIIVYSFLPLWLLSYLYKKLSDTLAWVCSIGLIYTATWYGISYLVMQGYIQYYGHTWLDIEVFFYLLGLKHIYVAYFLSLIPLLGLGVLNYRKKNK